jgi:hypothetical protein
MRRQYKSVMTGVRIVPGLGTTSEPLAAAIDEAIIDSAPRHLLDSTDRQSDCRDASSPTPQNRSAAAT